MVLDVIDIALRLEGLEGLRVSEDCDAKRLNLKAAFQYIPSCPGITFNPSKAADPEPLSIVAYDDSA